MFLNMIGSIGCLFAVAQIHFVKQPLSWLARKQYIKINLNKIVHAQHFRRCCTGKDDYPPNE